MSLWRLTHRRGEAAPNVPIYQRDREYVDGVLGNYLRAGLVVSKDDIDALTRGLNNYIAYVRAGKIPVL